MRKSTSAAICLFLVVAMFVALLSGCAPVVVTQQVVVTQTVTQPSTATITQLSEITTTVPTTATVTQTATQTVTQFSEISTTVTQVATVTTATTSPAITTTITPPLPVTDVVNTSTADKLFSLGLGYGVNALTASSPVGNSRLTSIFDSSIFTPGNLGSYEIGSSRSTVTSAESITDIMTSFNSKLTLGGSANVALDGLFSAGFTSNFALNTAASAQNNVYQYYFIQNYYYSGKNYQLKDYLDNYAYESKLTAGFRADLERVRSGAVTSSAFLAKYGTHVVMDVCYGGMIESYFAIYSQKQINTSKVEMALTSSINASLLGIISGKKAMDFAQEANSEIHESNTTSVLNVRATGGTTVSSWTLDQIAEGFPAWVASLNDPNNQRIVDVADGGLVPIWYYFPADYDDVADKIIAEFYRLAAQEGLSLATKMKAPTSFAGGSGTATDPYLISTATHLKNIAKSPAHMNADYKLINDIDISNEEWIPIGDYYWPYKTSPLNVFSGSFDGGGYKIKYKMTVSGTSSANSYAYGLFATASNATFSNLKVDATITTPSLVSNGNSPHNVFAGGIVGRISNCTVTNCYSSGNIYMAFDGSSDYAFNDGVRPGGTEAGGLVGLAFNSTISNCQNSAKVYARGFFADAGGVVGWKKATTITNCSNSGDISAGHGGWLFGAHTSGQLYGASEN